MRTQNDIFDNTTATPFDHYLVIMIDLRVLFGVYFGSLRIEGMSLLKLSLFHFSINFPGQFVNNEIDFGDYETISLIILTLPMMIYGFRRLYLLSKLTTNK